MTVQADVKADPMARILRLRAHLNPDGAGDDIDWERLEWWAIPARRAAEKAAGNDQPPAARAAGGIGGWSPCGYSVRRNGPLRRGN